MIAHCRHCHNAFWRYRRDYPPKGFCSVPCAQAGPAHITDAAALAIVPPRPETVLINFRTHRKLAHDGASILHWFPDCAACNELDADYAASLAYWISESSAELAGNHAALLKAARQMEFGSLA